MALFESYERRIDKINVVVKEYGFNSLEETKILCYNTMSCKKSTLWEDKINGTFSII